MKWYGIKMNGVPMGFYTSSNDGDFCCDIEYSLDSNSTTMSACGNIWLVPRREYAEKAMVTDTKWWNANYDSPRNDYVGKNLEVFEVDIA